MQTPFTHQIIFVRHAQTTYSNIYPDITVEGAEQLRRTAEEIRSLIFNDFFSNLTVIASPAIRAQGSASVLVEQLQHDGEIITEPLLSDMNVCDWPRAKELFNKCLLNGGCVEDVYDFDDRFEDASIFEARSAIRDRFFRYIHELNIALAQSTEPQCILAVSHFEVLNHFLRNLWPDAPWLRWAGMFRIVLPDTGKKASVHYAERSQKIDIAVLLQKDPMD